MAQILPRELSPVRRGAARGAPDASVEVQLLPRAERPDFLWSYVWTIDLSARETARLAAFLREHAPCRRRLHAFIRSVVRRAASKGLPFGPGTLADYALLPESSVIRWRPMGAPRTGGDRAIRPHAAPVLARSARYVQTPDPHVD